MNIEKMFNNVNVAILAADENFKVIYQNDKCRKIFEQVFERSDFIGASIHECHSPTTTEKVKQYYQEYAEKKRELDYYVMDEPTGKITVVNVPFYDGEKFSGIVEYIFESSLA